MFINYVSIICIVSQSITCVKFLSTNQLVSTSHGIVQGKERRAIKGSTYFSYEGIPFAKPPLNNLRFRPPNPARPWRGVLNAKKQSIGCIESRFRFIGVETVGVEDCLYLNIYTPVNLNFPKQKMAPVIVWIYGGGFMEGTASSYKPDNLIDNGIIVVTFNYRLGMFGFLNTEDKASPGNYGLKDQNAALNWVNANIAKFGGDPNTITISGHSAGASSVMYHVFSHKSKGLFKRAIAWSGETSTSWSRQKSPKTIVMDIASNLGIKSDNTSEIVQRLRKVSISDLKTTQILIIIAHTINVVQNGLPFTPGIEPDHDEAFITQDPFEIVKKGNFKPVPVIIGMTSMEVGLFAKIFNLIRPLLTVIDISPSSLPNGLRNISFLKSRTIGQKIINKYLGSRPFASATNTELTEIYTDILFTKPIADTVRALSSVAPVYFYVSGHPENFTKKALEIMRYPVDVDTPGVVHGEDMPLIWYFNNFGTPPGSGSLRKKYTKMWHDFAITGNPTPNTDLTLDSIIWPPVNDTQNIPYLWMGEELKILNNYKKDKIEFWDSLNKENEIIV